MSETFLRPPKIVFLIGPLYRSFCVVCSKLMIMLPQTPFCFGESNFFCIFFDTEPQNKRPSYSS